jgi:hypothetical protein
MHHSRPGGLLGSNQRKEVNTIYYIVAAGIMLVGVAYASIKTYFSEKRRNLRHMLRGEQHEKD